ncbi:MAG: flagellar motor switch protein FliM [Bdellovibrionota bacterium]
MAITLRPEEIAALVARAQDSTATAGANPDGAVRKLDLIAGNERIARGRLPTIEVIGERFSRTFRPVLSKLLGRTCNVHNAAVQQIKFGAFVKQLTLPTSMHLFRMPPLPAQALVVVSTPLVFALVDVLFGGAARKLPKATGRDFTAIENRMVAKVVTEALTAFADAWSSVAAIECVYSRAEVNPLSVSIVPSTDLVVTVSVDVEIEQIQAPIVFCLPWNTLNPIRDKLAAAFHAAEIEPDHASRTRVQEHLRHAQSEIRVILAVGDVKVRELVKLKVGDILPLRTPADSPASVLIEGTKKFEGTIGTSRGMRSVQISSAPNRLPGAKRS